MIKNLLPKLTAALALVGFGAVQSGWGSAIHDNTMDVVATAQVPNKAATTTASTISSVAVSPGAQAFAPGNEEQVLLKATVTVSDTGPVKANSITIDFGDDAAKAEADLHNLKVFTTKNTNFVGEARKVATLVGQTATISGRTVTVAFANGLDLPAGNTIFYITADVKKTATVGDSINTVLKNIVYNTNQTKTVDADPEGMAQIFSVESMPYKPYDLNSHYWRIPAMVVLRNQKDTTKNGRIVTMADMRFSHGADLPNHIDVYESHSDDNGKTWTKAQIVAGKEATDHALVPTGNHGFGDAALVETAGGRLVAIMVAGAYYFSSTPSKPNIPFIITSDDGGETWTAPRSLYDVVYKSTYKQGQVMGSFAGSGRGLLLKRQKDKSRNGRIMFAMSHRFTSGNIQEYIIYSDDEGKNWKMSPNSAFDGGDESKLVELADGTVMISVRRSGPRGFNTSSDGGMTWGEQWNNSTISGNACNGDILYYGKNVLLHSYVNNSARKNVSVCASYDNGRTWVNQRTICAPSSVYSTMDILPDGQVAMLYEDGACSDGWILNYVSFPVDWVVSKTPAKESVKTLTAEARRLIGQGSYTSVASSSIGQFSKETIDALAKLLPADGAIETMTEADCSTLADKLEDALEDCKQTCTTVPGHANSTLFAIKSYQSITSLSGNGYLTNSATTQRATDETAQQWQFIPAGASGKAYIKAKGQDRYLYRTDNNSLAVSGTPQEWLVSPSADGGYVNLIATHKAATSYLVVNVTDGSLNWFSSPNDRSPWSTKFVLTEVDGMKSTMARAKAALEKTGVGYPSSEARAKLQAAITAAESASDQAAAAASLEETVIIYKTTTDIQMPEDGKVYTISTIGLNGKKCYMGYNSSKGDIRIALTSDKTNANYPTSAKFLFKSLSDGRYVIIASDGKYFIWRGSDAGYNSNKGYIEQTNALFCDYVPITIEKLTTDGNANVVAESQENLFGYVAMKGQRSDGQTLNYFVIKNGTSYDQATSPFYKSTNATTSFSSALLIEEATTTDEEKAAFETALAQTTNASILLADKISDANEVLAKTGVGYPAADSEARTALKNKVDEAGTPYTSIFTAIEANDNIQSLISDYKSATDIQLPEEGKAYTMTFVGKTGKRLYMNYAENGYTAVITTEKDNSKYPMTAKLICRKMDNGKFVFVNNGGKYLAWRNKSTTGLNGGKGYVDSYPMSANPEGETAVANVNKEINCISFTISKIVNGENQYVTGTNDALLGLVKVVSDNRNAKDATDGCYIVKLADNNFDTSTGPFFNDDFTSAVLLEETSYPNSVALHEAKGIEGIGTIGTFSAPFRTIVPEGVKAYYVGGTAAGTDGTTATTVEIPAGEAIPANTGVLLTAAAETATALMLPALAEADATITDNKLHSSAGADKAIAANENAYILTSMNDKVAFYICSPTNRTIGMNKSYLVLDSAAAVSKLSLNFGTTTGINAIPTTDNAGDNAPTFDLAGRRVTNLQKGGIYIKGGKKFIVK